MSDLTGNIPGNGELQGVISSAALIAGNVVGMRGLPGEKGDKGDTGNTGPQGADGTDGVSPEITIAEITGGHSITITDAEHPSGQTVNVMDGTDGEDGTDGTDGTDGVSPEVTISEITGGHSVTITDADHPTGQTFNVLDGTDGQDGTDGTDGQDGYSPTASVSKSGSTATITITDKNGTTTAEVYDGEGSITDVTQNGTSVLDGTVAKVTVPTKTSDLTNDSGYITGYTETDPTVPSWAKASAKPSYSYSEISNTPTLATVATTGDYDDLTDKPTIPTKITDLTDDSDFVSEDIIADEYSTSSTYAVGDYCIYDGQLYRCTTAITTAEAWTAAHWTAVTVADEFTDLKGDIPQAVSELTNDSGYQTASQVATAVSEAKVLVVDIASFSSLPQTVTNSSITSDMVVVNSVLGTPSAQTGNWTVTTGTGTMTVSGSINGSTTLTLYLAESM